MENFQQLLLQAGLSTWVFMSCIFLISLIRKDNSIVDIAWGVGFLIIIWSINPGLESWSPMQTLFNFCVHIWALRLAGYLFLRHKNQGEDWRYANWKKEWGKWYLLRSYFQVYMLQGFFMLIIASPLVLANSSYSPSESRSGFIYFGLLVFVFGYLFEVIGDYQKSKFKRDPSNKGKTMKTGLWSLTRHPNYFGEAVLWWGIWLMVVPLPYFYLTIVSPIVLTWLLRYVSGVPLTEERKKGNKEFEDYKKEVPAFIPKVPGIKKRP